MAYYETFGGFGKGFIPPPPLPAPEDPTAPTITPEEEAAILEALLPIPEPEPSFLRRNAIPIFIGGGVLIFGTIGMLLMIRV